MNNGPVRSLASRAAHTFKAITADIKNPPFVAPGHYYSPSTSPDNVRRAMESRRTPVGIDLAEEAQCAFAAELGLSVPPVNRWTTEGNTMFGAADASMLRAMLLTMRPHRFVEVGSGFSTAAALDVAEETLPDLSVTCIEPYADRLRSRLHAGDLERLTLIERPVQDIEPADLVSGLQPGDIFFIDSTHVVKAGSDVCHLFLHTLPRIPVGVFVHVHDVFWPFEYPDEWLRAGRDWTEDYLLQAFLTHNHDWRIRLFGSWLWSEHPELATPGTESERPGSIWLERIS